MEIANDARRSTRIGVEIPVCISSLDPAVQFSENCHTLVVNKQGCGLRLSQALAPGVAVLLDELPSGRTATGRVAHSVPLGAPSTGWLVGVALDEPANVWGIGPAPADWGEEPVVTAAIVAPPAKKDQWAFAQFSRRGEFHTGRK